MTSQGPRWTGEVMLVEKDLEKPLSWRTPARVFVNSTSDLFYDRIPEEYFRRVWDVMLRADWHTFQILTKRPETMLERTRDLAIPSHIWLGVSVESAAHVDRIDLLRQVDAPIRFLSLEPLLTALPNLNLDGISWVIAGGESGRGARPMPAEWVRDIRDQCVRAGVPFFFKQWGGPRKGATGRELDGRTWDQYPDAVQTRTKPILPILQTRFDAIVAEAGCRPAAEPSQLSDEQPGHGDVVQAIRVPRKPVLRLLPPVDEIVELPYPETTEVSENVSDVSHAIDVMNDLLTDFPEAHAAWDRVLEVLENWGRAEGVIP